MIDFNLHDTARNANDNYHSLTGIPVLRGGTKVWLQASHNPIGVPRRWQALRDRRVRGPAVTATKLAAVDARAQLGAIAKSQAVIELDFGGTFRHVNQNFLTMLGHDRHGIHDQHDRVLINREYANSKECATL